ncbi:MAG TPA: hypothetical protein VEU96_06825 [Bryobacteraceae bacterium]|nr:hypothetical protein [Bryobacteraceae bacterium]
MPSKIVDRILADTGVPKLFSALAEELPLSDLQSLLLEVYQARSASLSERDLVTRAQRGLMTPSKVDARLLHDFDRVAYQVAEKFEAIELSPVGPLGLNRVLGEVGQNNVLTTVRNAEVLGDATMALALECARRRKGAENSTVVRLCNSQRLIRMQPFDFPGYVPHFRLFSMVSAGRDSGGNAFELEHLGEHVRFYLRLFAALNGQGFRFGGALVEISEPAITAALLESHGISQEQVRASIRAHRVGGSERFLAEHGVSLPDRVQDPSSELADIALRHDLAGPVRLLVALKDRIAEVLREFPDAQMRFNFARLEGLAYYTGPCLRISPAAPDGRPYPIVDGGFTNWTARLLQNRKERLLTTGVGTEFACVQYR